MPKLKSITIDADSGIHTVSSFALKCKKLESFRWYHSYYNLRVDGFEFRKFKRLKHLSLDGCRFEQDGSSDTFLKYVRNTIEEVSVPNVRLYGREWIPVEWIREFIRKAPRLRRFRTTHGVLTAYQISQARLDRPDVEFIMTNIKGVGNRNW